MKKPYLVLSYLAIAILCTIVIISGLATYKNVNPYSRSIDFEKGKVLEIHNQRLVEDSTIPGIYSGVQEVTIEVTTGAYKGNTYPVRNILGRTYNVYLEEGMTVILSVYEDSVHEEQISVYSYKRENYIYLLLLLFISLICLIGKNKGIKSILSLIFTGIMIVFFLIPLLLKGHNPIFISILTAILSIAIGLYLINGWEIKTLAAIAGTTSGVAIAGGISYTFGSLANLSGLNIDKGEPLMHIADYSGLQVKGIMFSIILIASLGAIMDVGMSIASAATELNKVNKKLSFKELLQSTMNVGADIIGTMSNTLVLAFTGGMLPILLITFFNNISYRQFINLDYIAVEIIQALSGSIGIVLTVPITAYISVLLIKKFSDTSHNKKKKTKGE